MFAVSVEKLPRKCKSDSSPQTRWSKLVKNLPLVRAHICSDANSIMHYFMLVEHNILHSE